MSQRLKITYIGGGSQYVIPVINGLASREHELKGLGRPIDLQLLDPDLQKARINFSYAQLVAQQTGLPITAHVTDDAHKALDGSDWVIFGIGLEKERRAIWSRYRKRVLNMGESGLRVAIDAAVYWPWVRRFAGQIRALCPDALFCTLVNPTDVLGPAVESVYSLSAIGLCVEVPQLKHWLAYYLRTPHSDIDIEYMGLNHFGWVSRIKINGETCGAELADVLAERMTDETWYPETDWFVEVFKATGYMRTGPYHSWPFIHKLSEERKIHGEKCAKILNQQKEARRIPVETALKAGKMIQEYDPRETHPIATAYIHSSIHRTYGAIAAGLAGGTAEPAPIQARNGTANPSFPQGAWLEAPTRIEKSRALPQTVFPLPDGITRELQTIAHQRMLLAQWLSTGNAGLLKEALMLWPNDAPVEVLLELCGELPVYSSRTIQE